MQSEANHDARAERAIILHLLDPDHDRDWAPGELAHVISEEDAVLDAEEVEAAAQCLATIGLVENEELVWRAAPALRRLDELELIAV